MKISIIGAGLVGTTTCVNLCKKKFIDEIVLVDINPNVEGKVMDIMQSKAIYEFKTDVYPLYDNSPTSYEITQNSDIAIITSGIPRKPGMTREELIDINKNIVFKVTEKLITYSPNIILIIVTNPMDIIVNLLRKNFNIPSNRIIGMGGILDASRFKYYIQKNISIPIDYNLIYNVFVIGSHTDTHMIPLINHVTINGNYLKDILNQSKLSDIVEKTKKGGAIITQKQGYSAGYAPAAAICVLVEAIVKDSKKILCCGSLLNGEYGVSDICIGVPTVIGKNGIEKNIELELNGNEKKLFYESVNNLRLVLNSYL